MSTPAPSNGSITHSQPFTNSEHIQQLNNIDRSITQLLRSAGLAIETLTASQPMTTLDDRKKSFGIACDLYLKTLQSVDVHLRRQIMALEEADIVPDKPKLKKAKATGSNLPGYGGKSLDNVTDEGGMNFDIGWLNSRSGQVPRDMEAELWEKANALLESAKELKSDSSVASSADGDHHMGV